MNIHLPSSNVTIFGDHFRLIVSPAIVNSKNRMTIPLHFLAGWNEVYYTIFTCIYIPHLFIYIYMCKHLQVHRMYLNSIPDVVRKMFLHSLFQKYL